VTGPATQTRREAAAAALPLESWWSAFEAADALAARRPAAAPLRDRSPPDASARRAQAGLRPGGGALSSMPDPSPLPMPRQDLRRTPRPPPLASAGRWRRRAVLVLGSGAIAAAAGATLGQVMGFGGLTAAEWTTIALSTILSGWVGFGFVSAGAGFVAALRAHTAAVAAPLHRAPVARTAILLAACNEDPGLIFAGVEAMAADLQRLGHAASYDFFVLSDTRDAAISQDEAAGLLRTRLRVGARPGIFYRRRAVNADRKAGNIADWVQSHGGAYPFMLVLDADSLMSAEAIVALTLAMEDDPRLGLLQSVPTIINAQTPFARLQQFASRLYGPIYALGQQWWSGDEGNYWGHNAIVRVAAFAQSAGLPHLAGRQPWGGHILSHDFVEAALLRRRGWKVRTLATLPGSYEETPPTILDTALRDRRWCQGNLQHARLVGAAGLHWVSRLHLLLGILAYLAPALWLALFVDGAIVWPTEHLKMQSAQYPEVIGVYVAMLSLLAAPKAMALGLALGARGARRGFGGGARLCLGVAVELLASMIITPMMMVMQSVAVIEVVVGRDSGWRPQRREGVELNRREAWRAHRGHVALGTAGALGALVFDRYMLLWASPVFLSLALSAVLSLHTSRPGKALGRPVLLRIPEDEAPPPVLTRARALRRAYADEAALRRQIDALFRAPPPVYELKAPSRIARAASASATAAPRTAQLGSS